MVMTFHLKHIDAMVAATDKIAAEGIRARGLLFFPMLPWTVVMVHRSTATISVAATLSLTALVFVSWRFWVVLRRQAIAGDRVYDRKAKFDLAPEYHETESSTAAKDRK